MSLIDGNVVMLVFAVIITIAAVAAFMIPPGGYDETRWKVFVTTIAALGIGLVFFVNYSNIEYLIRQQDLLKIKEMDGIVSKVDSVLALMEDGVEIAPRFVSELHPLEGKKSTVEKKDGKSLKVVTYKNRLSKKIFYLWQLVVNENKFVKDEDGAFMALFVQWATSKSLKNSWKKSRITCNEQGRQFGDLLFFFSSQVKEYTSDEFMRITLSMMSTEEYKKLFCIE